MAEAESLLREGLACAGLAEKDLAASPANDPRKVELARLIWKKTTVSQGWISEKLGMRNAANVSLALHRRSRLKELPAALQEFVKMEENAH